MRKSCKLVLLAAVLSFGRGLAAETEWRGTNDSTSFTFFYNDESGAVRGYMVDGRSDTNILLGLHFDWSRNLLTCSNGPTFHLESSDAKEGWSVGTFTNERQYRVTIKFFRMTL